VLTLRVFDSAAVTELVIASAINTSAAVMNKPNQYIHFSDGSG